MGLSGGKDSLSLAHVLKHMQRVAPFDLSLKQLQLLMVWVNLRVLHEHCLAHEIDHEIVDTKIFDVAQDKIH